MAGFVSERLGPEHVGFDFRNTRLTAGDVRARSAELRQELKERRAARERQEIQRQIDAFQQGGGAGGSVDVDELLARKMREARAAQADG